jgi:ribosome-binding protein aMBF1 (putative translation factor)
LNQWLAIISVGVLRPKDAASVVFFDDGDPEVQRLQREFGRDLREARRRARLSQAAVAARLGLTQPYVSLVERGLRNLTLSVMSGLARVVGYDLQIAFRPSQRPSDE